MIHEDFQKLVLEQLSKLNADVSNINANMATKDDIARLERLANGTMEIIETIYRDVEKIATQQEIQRESINIIHLRQLQTEAELSLLKKAL